MLILGLNGNNARVHEDLFQSGLHDASAVLLEDGEVVAAIEEERLTRIKHAKKAPFNAIRFCLAERGIQLCDVDRIAWYTLEDSPEDPFRTAVQFGGATLRQVLCAILGQEFRTKLDPQRIRFVEHHVAHAASAYACSGFDESLVMTFDGTGDNQCGIVARGASGKIDVLHRYPTGDQAHETHSLGWFYMQTIGLLGYHAGDEYKVMGLAPYGDPKVFRSAFEGVYELRGGGDYVIHLDRLVDICRRTGVRKQGEPFTQLHMDLSAGLQEAFVEIAFHAVRHFREATGLRRLCLAGGAAHNCTLNGKLLSSGLFEEVFVQPASHDAGCALGAAYQVDAEERGYPKRTALRHVYWGTDIRKSDVGKELGRWSTFLSFTQTPRFVEETAELLSNGAAVGWAQGRSEFGPRALGNRSILADPRPAQNKQTINALVKKRESYRPFAPVILEERLHEFFEVPTGTQSLPFMVFVVGVKPDKRAQLGAVTHVDGTARVQTIDARDNELLARLIGEFDKRTGVPILLNTSFNNNNEPIVDSVEDAIVCFLTTGLLHLVVGDYMVTKKDVAFDAYASLVPTLPQHVKLRHQRASTGEKWVDRYALTNTYQSAFERAISAETYRALLEIDETSSIGALLGRAKVGSGVLEELVELWHERLLALSPSRLAEST